MKIEGGRLGGVRLEKGKSEEEELEVMSLSLGEC